jgi:orotate phosphoribosyltransferase
MREFANSTDRDGITVLLKRIGEKMETEHLPTLQDRVDFVWRQVKFYIKNDAFQEGDFTLSWGLKSKYYIDMANIINNPLCLPRLVELLHREIIEIIRASQPPNAKGEWWKEKLVGIGGVALGGALLSHAYASRHPYLFPFVVRIQRAELECSPHMKPGKVLLIDDVLTTGKSLLLAKHILNINGYEVSKALVIVDRQEGGLEKCKGEGLEVKSFFKLSDILEG